MHNYKLMMQFPKPEDSRCLAWRNLMFHRYNPRLGILTGILYLIFGLTISAKGLADFGLSSPPPLSAVLLTAAFCLACYRFCDSINDSWTSWLIRVFWGGFHGLLHVAAAITLAVLANSWSGIETNAWWPVLVHFAVSFGGGYVVAPLILGVYLLISLNAIGIHHNEAFSSLRIADFKNFLRLRIKSDGALEIFPIALPRIGDSPILIEKIHPISPKEGLR